MKFKDLAPYIAIVVVVVLIRSFIVTPVTVSGSSMDPTLKDKEILLLAKFNKNYQRFDVVVINYENERIIKRIIGVPGDNIKYVDNVLYVNDEKIDEPFSHGKTEDFTLEGITYDVYDKIPEGHYLVLGDNRPKSYDSRMIGLIDKEDIVGKSSIRIFPFNKIGSFE